jgi:hypothetical protein
VSSVIQLVGDRALDVWGVAMAAPLRGVEVEVRGQRGEVRLEEPRIYQPAVQQHQWFALAVLVVPGLHRTKLRVGRHRCSLLVAPRSYGP